MPSTDEGLAGLLAVCQGHVAAHEYATQLARDVSQLRAEVAKLKAEGVPGQMHDVDRAFYELTIAQRNNAWREVEQLRSQLERLRERVARRQDVLEHVASKGKLEVAALTVAQTGCREWIDEGTPLDRCPRPAEFILWGKLFDKEALGPRCYDHAAARAGHHVLDRVDQAAVVDLRPLRRALNLVEEPA